MEIFAAIAGLSALRQRASVTLYSDSQYLVKAMTRGWLHKWRANNWMRTKTDPVLNADLWKRLELLSEKHEVQFRWIRGHSANVHNAACDHLARRAAASADLLVDSVYEADLLAGRPRLKWSGRSVGPQQSTEPPIVDPNDVHQWLRARLEFGQYQTVDRRRQGGALWVIAGAEFRAIARLSAKRGVRFSFAENGGKASGNRPAWYTKWLLG